MSFSFLAPLFAAGAALLVIPYLVHQIRRPERDLVPFSSLLFIPNISKEVIERRRIQHLLLMLLRMLLFLLLALAFARPYLTALAGTEGDAERSHHLILLDTSYSMGVGGVFEEAKREARRLVSEIEQGDSVGVLIFAGRPEVLAPLRSDTIANAGSPQRAREAIDSATLTQEATAYLPALREGQNLLSASQGSEEEDRANLVLYVVSDFKKNGMPERHSGWKLPTDIRLVPIPIESPSVDNQALSDIGVKRAKDGALRVLGKVKNWADSEAKDVRVSLVLNGEEQGANTLEVAGGNASQTSFEVNLQGDDPVEGWLELGPDALEIDNRRYFTWNPPRKKRVLLLSDERADQPWPAGWFFTRALPAEADLPWTADEASQEQLNDVLNNPARRPDVVVAGDLDGLSEGAAVGLLEYVDQGGRVLFVLNETMNAETVNDLLLDSLGLRAAGLRYDGAVESRFDLLSWVDLEHEIFTPFRGARFNDFSTLRFYNHWEVNRAEADEDAKIIARFDDGSPAVVERGHGQGRVVLWTFPVSLEYSNLPKSTRFVPIFHETLAYLTDLSEGTKIWTVGEQVREDVLAFDDDGETVLQTPSLDEPSPLAADAVNRDESLTLRAAGFFRTRTPAEAQWRHIDAVNVDARESDPTPVDVAEFELKLAASPVMVAQEDESGGMVYESREGTMVTREFGYYLLLALFLFLILESWYMTALKR